MANLEMSKGGCFSLNRSQMLVKKGATDYFQLTFRPTWVCQTTGLLTLKNECSAEALRAIVRGMDRLEWQRMYSSLAVPPAHRAS